MARARGRKAAEEEQQDISTVTVRLKPVLGIRPPVYLCLIYGLLILLLLYLLLFLPGIRNRGTWFSFSSTPPGAAVYVNGLYVGATPVESLVPPGTQQVEISRPLLEPARFEVHSSGRVFATLFVRPRARRAVDLVLRDASGYARYHLQDFASYAHLSSRGLLSAATDVLRLPANRRPEVFDELYGLVLGSMYFCAGEGGHLPDVLHAAAAVSARGGLFDSAALVRLTAFFRRVHAGHGYLPYWFIMNLPRGVTTAFTDTPSFRLFHAATVAAVSRLPAAAPSVPSPALTVGALRLRFVPAGLGVAGNDTELQDLTERIDAEMPRPVTVDSFYMSETEITNAQYAAFVEAVPRWRASSREALLSEGLVSREYLESWVDDRPPEGAGDLPVTGVSWHAATAFCDWMGENLPARFEGYAARLPFEAEWEWAARGGLRGTPYADGAGPGTAVFRTDDTTGPAPVADGDPNGYGLYDMSGNVWEWCADWYAPAAALLASRVPSRNAVDTRSEVPAGVERAVRGGGWANYAQQIRVYTRGSQPPEWCTRFLGFRIVMARDLR